MERIEHWPVPGAVQEASEFGKTNEESEVCADLITHFPTLFHIDAEEMEKVGIVVFKLDQPEK